MQPPTAFPLHLFFFHPACIIVILCLATTLLVDALRKPKGATYFFWCHWWHTPLLVYTAILVQMTSGTVVLLGGWLGVTSTLFAVGLVIFIWTYWTIHNQGSLTYSHKGESRVPQIANPLMAIGGTISLAFLCVYLGLWLGFPLAIVFLTCVFLYFTGFLLRVIASTGKRPEET
ncbi:MAG: hypothetical protein ACFFCO_04890 [Promethearchaeota archaeon]